MSMIVLLVPSICGVALFFRTFSANLHLLRLRPDRYIERKEIIFDQIAEKGIGIHNVHH